MYLKSIEKKVFPTNAKAHSFQNKEHIKRTHKNIAPAHVNRKTMRKFVHNYG